MSNASKKISTPITVAQGGTGETDATEGFDSLAPTTTKGDVIVHNGTDNIRLAVGTNDQVLTADSTQASGVKWADAAGGGGGGGGAVPYFDDDGTQLVGPWQLDSNTGGIAAASDQILYLMPIWIGADGTLNNLTTEVTTAVTGSTFRMGIYNHGTGGPTTLLTESAVISSATTGIKDSAALSTAITAGWYWVGLSCDENAGAVSFRGIANYKGPLWYYDSGSVLAPRNSFYKTSVDPASSLPSPYTATGQLAASQFPGVWCRISI